MLALDSTLEHLGAAVKGDSYWEEYTDKLRYKADDVGLHVAIMLEPYLSLLLGGLKTVESRFSTKRLPPYKTVRPGDAILVKQSGGPIVGICRAEEVWDYHLDPKSWRNIREEFETGLSIQDPTFWQDKEHAEYATLIRIGMAKSIVPIEFYKRDRRGWIVLRRQRDQMKLDDLI